MSYGPAAERAKRIDPTTLFINIPSFHSNIQSENDPSHNVKRNEAKMRFQPPDNNNPANPLIKVASLEIDKEIKKTGTKYKTVIKVKLNFKQSDDLKGKAHTKDGEQITVTFGLSIKRASLELSTWTDKQQSADNMVGLDKVAFTNQIALKDHVVDDVTYTGKLDRDGSIKIGGSGNAGLISGSLKADARISGGLKSFTEKKQKRKISRKSSRTNIAATYAGGRVHWEINPGITAAPDQLSSYLDGDVFRSENTGKQIDACIMTMKDGSSLAGITVRGSVFTSMQDIIVGRIEFTDDFGTVAWSKVEKLRQQNSTSFSSIFQVVTKERLLKQIIRKHLLEQGMKTDGARVEICRAEV